MSEILVFVLLVVMVLGPVLHGLVFEGSCD